MTRDQAWALVVVALLLVAAGFSWLYGPLVLIGSGVVLGVVAMIANLKE